jgi:phosphoglucosamine mutase
MSNKGLEEYLSKLGLELIRSDVGDKYVLEKMLETGARLGGEKSGHIIPIDYASTGDGLVAALQILAYIRKNNILTSSIRSLYQPYPQVFKNIDNVINLSDHEIIKFIKNIETTILQEGRIIIRKSGTENTTRVMIESNSKMKIDKAVAMIEEFISNKSN